jgi:hypothetical protein
MDEKKVLMDKKIPLEINGRDYKIGKLPIRRYTELLDIFASTIEKSQEKLAKFSEGADSRSNLQDFLMIIKFLDNKELARFISVMLGEDDINFIEKNLESGIMGAEEITEILAIICEENKFQIVKKNIMRVLKVFSQK